jgi:hypothetical protein
MRLIIAAIAILIMIAVAIPDEVETFKYVGVSKCKMCHKTKKSGNQYELWLNGPHAKAYETLASEASIEIAKGMGIENPQTSDQCLSCHTTAHGIDVELKEETLTTEEGVSCEQCHGPGSAYKKMTIMKDREKSIANGLIIPTEESCVECHNKKSPTYKPFKYEERVKQIAHPVPVEETKSEG